MNRVLAADWPAGATRSVKGHAIPQVAHTLGYHTGGYAAMNEHQVGLAESTCSGRHFPPTNKSRSGFMDIVQLGQLALERANTSRAAVRTMGMLAETWGYSDATESLLVIDPYEAFIFQIMADDTGNSSVSENEESCSKNEELCSKTEEFSIKNEKFCIKNDEICRSGSHSACRMTTSAR